MIQPVGDDGVVIPAVMSETLNIRADLQGSPRVCVLDTGSSFSLLMSQGTADALKLPHGEPVGLGTATGTATGYRTSLLVVVAGKVILVDDAVVAPTHKWFPLIGLPLIKRIGRLLTVDWETCEVEFDPTPDVTQKTITMQIDSKDYTANGERRTMDVAPQLTPENRTLVPIRFVAEALGAEVGWDQETRTVTISRTD